MGDKLVLVGTKFVQRLQEMREEQGLTMHQLSLKLGLGVNTVYKWEVEGQVPNANYIAKVCEYFGCSADYLLGLRDE